MFSLLAQSRVTLICLTLCSVFTMGQTYGQFTSILNIPPDPDIGDNQSIGSNTQLNLSDGGEIGFGFAAGAFDGTNTNVEVNIIGGSVGDHFDAFSDSVVNISGGSVGDIFQAVFDSEVNISGGSVGQIFQAFDGSVVNISGGSVGAIFDAFDGSVVNISGGEVGTRFEAFEGSVVNISGGAVGDRFDALSGSVVNISGGVVDGYFQAIGDSVVNISGGVVGDEFDACSGSVVNISGGSIGDDFVASNSSTVSLFGTQFVLDALDITASLTLNVPLTIIDRDVTLSGLLANGSPFSFDLNSTVAASADYFDPGATLTVTLILPGDFDFDGDVDGADFLMLQQGLGTIYNATHLAAWEANYGNPLSTTSVTVPEPATLGIVLIALVCFPLRVHRALVVQD